jgi:hypothetical protein
MSTAAKKKILDNAYTAAVERVIGKARESQSLHHCWEGMSRGKKLRPEDYTREMAATKTAYDALLSFEAALDADAARMSPGGAFAVFDA